MNLNALLREGIFFVSVMFFTEEEFSPMIKFLWQEQLLYPLNLVLG